MDKKAFLLKQKNIAVIGVTTDSNKYGYKIYKTLKEHGFNTYGISNKYTQLDDDPLYPNLNAINQPLDLVVFVVNSRYSYPYIDECKQLGIATIWLQPGTYDKNSLDYIKLQGIDTIEDCVLVQLGK